ncbi:putative UbiA prenyltransferase [Candidatus Zixiibacteriota bacterium]|nr:putative UbiA prenyltransferase [candidate division Zixibacteria bacterium]
MKILDFLFAARPMLLLPVWSIYLVSFNSLSGGLNLKRSSLIVLASLTLMTAGVYFINQIFDYESDLKNGKLGFLQKGLIRRSQMMAAYLSVTALAWVLIFMQSFFSSAIIILATILGLAYSVPPIKLKDRPISGLLANSLGYGVLVPLLVMDQFADRTNLMLYLPAYFFSAIAAGYMLTIIPDRPGDLLAEKKTLAIHFPNRILIVEGIVFLTLSALFALMLKNGFLLGISIIAVTLYIMALIAPKKEIILFACKFPIFLLTLLAGYYFPVYLVFIIALLILTRIYYHKRFKMTYPRLN